ncbi:MAG: hypothetical protein WBA67_15695 [Jannaschia sp.]
MTLRACFICFLLAAAPVAAAPNAQLVASVQHDLDAFGYSQVDAGTLSTRQIAALYLHLGTRRPSITGLSRLRTRQRIDVILGWDAPAN